MGRVSRRPEVFPEKDKVLSDQGRRLKSENRFATFATPFVRREKSRTTRGPWCLDPPMLGDEDEADRGANGPLLRTTKTAVQHAVAAMHERRCGSTASRQSCDQHAQCRRSRPNAARGRAQSSGERAHLVVVCTSDHLRVIAVHQLCRPSRLFSRMVSTRHPCANVVHNSVLQNVL